MRVPTTRHDRLLALLLVFTPAALTLHLPARAQCPPFELAKATEPTAVDEVLATAVDFDGTFMIAAAGAGSPTGAAYIFRKEVDPLGSVTWVTEQRVVAGDPVANDQFGQNVSISGQTAVVGTFTTGRPEGGAAFVYVRQPDGAGDFDWIQQQKLIPADGAAAFVFGASVAIEGERIAVGAIQADVPGASLAGAVYIFERSGTLWTEVDKIFTPDAEFGDRFGESVDLEGDRIAIGAAAKRGFDLADGTPKPGAGAVYVFDRVSDGMGGFVWQVQTKLVAPEPRNFAGLGADVGIDGDVVVASAINEQISGSLGIGAIYIFERDAGSSWPPVARFDSIDIADPASGVGLALDIDAGNLVVGVGSNLFGSNNGSAVLLQKPAASWEYMHTFRGSDTNIGVNQSFGFGVSVVAGDAMITAIGASDTGQPRLGAAYHFKLNVDPLLLTQHPTNALAPPGSPAAMNVVALGEGTLTFEWSRNGATIVDGPNVSGATTDTLSIASVGINDIGAYDCAVTNSCGTTISTPAALSFTAGSCLGDSNADNIVNFDDLITSLGRWLQVCP